MDESKGFRLSMVKGGFVMCLFLLAASFLPTQTSSTSTPLDGNDVTPSEVSSDRTHSRTSGGIAQPLRIAAVEVDPFFSRELTPSGDSFSGYLVDVVREMARIVPFQIEWVVVDKDDGNGRRKNGNSWAELTGKLTNGMADVSVLPLDSSNQIQGRRFSHTQPFLKSTLSLLLRASETPPDHRPLLLETLFNTSDYSKPEFKVTSERVALQLRTQNLSLYQRIWSDRNPSEVVVPLEEGLRRVRQGDLVLVVESKEADYYSSREPCDLQSHKQLTHEGTGYVFATRRNGTLAGLLGDALERIREGDFLEELYRKWWNTDECSLRLGEAERDDHNLDMERIFFTSPVKFFKSGLSPQVTLEGPRYSSLATVRSTQPELGPGEPEPGRGVHAKASDALEEDHYHRPDIIGERTASVAVKDWHMSQDGSRDRDSKQPLRTSPEPPGFEPPHQTDPVFNRRWWQRSRSPKQTTVPLRTYPRPTRTYPRVGSDAQGLSSRAERTRGPPGHGGWSEGRDSIQGSRQQKPSYTAATPISHRTTRSSRDFARDYDLVFVTELPRSDDEFDYEIDDDDDDDYHEQRMTVRIVETKQKDSIRVSNTKETSAKWEAKPKSNDKSSSRKAGSAELLTLATAFAGVIISRRFSL